ncbi:hypothetical protein MMC28_002918 [Mycoblastus sanguinarius]|nr:hypothetical protein [Mycoblastus sanguinarius]
MALAPKFAGQAYSANVSPKAVHTIELCRPSPPIRQNRVLTSNLLTDLDYVCPFSAKMFNTLYTSVFPLLSKKYPSKVQFLFRQQIQPWHPSSTLVHEAGTAVLRLSPDKFWPFSAALFEHQKDYFDVNVVNEARNDTYKRLAKLAESVGLEESKVYGLLKISDKPGEGGSLNVGNKVTDDVKLMIKVDL